MLKCDLPRAVPIDTETQRVSRTQKEKTLPLHFRISVFRFLAFSSRPPPPQRLPNPAGWLTLSETLEDKACRETRRGVEDAEEFLGVGASPRLESQGRLRPLSQSNFHCGRRRPTDSRGGDAPTPIRLREQICATKESSPKTQYPTTFLL